MEPSPQGSGATTVLLGKKEVWGPTWGEGDTSLFPGVLLRSSSQAGQMTFHSATSLGLVLPPTAATLLMVRALRATHQRTAGSSSGECAGNVPLGIGGRFMGQEKAALLYLSRMGLAAEVGSVGGSACCCPLHIWTSPPPHLLQWGWGASQKAMPEWHEGQCGETQVSLASPQVLALLPSTWELPSLSYKPPVPSCSPSLWQE